MFPPDDCAIFEFALPCGGKRFADPWRVRRRLLQATQGKLNDLLRQWASEEIGERAVAEERRAPVAAFAFELKPFDPATGQGAQEGYLLDLLERFVTWCDELKKKPPGSPASVRATASAPGLSPTPSSSVSNSTPAPCGCGTATMPGSA